MMGYEQIRLEKSIEIDAPAQIVFELLSDANGLLEWMAVEARVERVEGGEIWWRHENGATMRGAFVEVTPPRRLVFSYGWESGGPPVEPGQSLVEIDLVERRGGTLLKLVHSALPSSVAEEHRQGWDFFLEKLSQVAAGVARRTSFEPKERT